MKKGFFAALPAAILAVLSLACSETGGLGLDLDHRLVARLGHRLEEGGKSVAHGYTTSDFPSAKKYQR